MQRRHFIKAGLATGLTLASGSAIWSGIEQNNEPLTIKATLSKLELLSAKTSSTGQWDLYQILIHCAQSVEMSMSGYPLHKPDWFKATAGKLAFRAFSSKGRMHHSLSEPIPGAGNIAANGNIVDALSRFKTALLHFAQWQGALAPHFAYGQLTKQEYEIAHAMHFNNHLQEIKPQAV